MNPDPANESSSTQFTVYWQPGCSSCLRTKEFLKENGIAFRSVNVREDESAMQTLAALGARSIPVVTLGNEFVFAQDMEVLANFVGIELKRTMLPMHELVSRIDLLLAADQRYLLQLPGSVLFLNLPGRERSYLDLAFHAFTIPLAFLDAARGKELTFAHFERFPDADMRTADKVIAFGASVREEVNEWWRLEHKNIPETVLTYYGEHSSHSVLERTAWHTAQHVRQLMQLVSHQGLEPDGPLGESELSGLPLPEEVYDDEVLLTPTHDQAAKVLLIRNINKNQRLYHRQSG